MFYISCLEFVKQDKRDGKGYPSSLKFGYEIHVGNSVGTRKFEYVCIPF